MTNTLKCVLDTNVCIKYFIVDPLTPQFIQLFPHLAYPQTEMFVPDLFYIECTNVFLKYVRINMYTAAEVQSDLTTLKNLELQVVSTADLMDDAVNIALNYNISAYDASYVALSQQTGTTLLTLDKS
ncbi:type II toxin-antitoxin system VapC family toxin [Anabaena sp. WFMT]|uniref:type II toxin-antitoxin system VapC family toxin n=1 Tax=Anabaena sp. WFMT TaxID=3449730 RepID=UPI003F2527D6